MVMRSICLLVVPPLVACALASARPAQADEGALPPTTEFFDTYDQNYDGKVDAQEFTGSDAAFRLLDVNGDGMVAPEELGLPVDFRPTPEGKRKREQARGVQGQGDRMARLRERLADADTNQDGKVSRDEWPGRPEQFDRLDRNQDGMLDASDLQGRARGKGKRKSKSKGESADMEGRAERAAPRAERLLERLDTDGDGSLSTEELGDSQRLARADADGDGVVTLAELTDGLRRMRGGEREGRGQGRGGRRLTEGALRRFDKDGDGRVTEAEFPASARIFKRLDANGDGVLDAADLAPEQGDKAPAPPAAPKAPVTESASLIKALDKDGDGRLHRGEFAGTNEEWQRLDRDQDGWVTPEEVGEGPKRAPAGS